MWIFSYQFKLITSIDAENGPLLKFQSSFEYLELYFESTSIIWKSSLSEFNVAGIC